MIFFLILVIVAAGLLILIKPTAEVVDAISMLIKARQDEKRKKWEHENPAKNFLVNHTFRDRTLAGFSVLYRLNLECERIDVAETVRGQVDSPFIQEYIAGEFNDKVFDRHFLERSYFWHLDQRSTVDFDMLHHVCPTVIGEVNEENGTQVVREVPKVRLKLEVKNLPPLKIRGCQVRLMDFSTPALSDEMIEENYRVLSDEQKEAIMDTDAFGAVAEMLAVTLLKYRLDFLRDGSRKYKADLFTIETEKAGRSLKIKWEFASSVNGYYLWGFRDTEGFSNDPWNENKNGKRVVDSCSNGEVVEVLKEGVAYFYTFFLKPVQENEHSRRQSLLRFQMTIETKLETDAIMAGIRRFDERNQPDPAKENLSRAVRELGTYVEMDTAFEAMEKSFAEQIRKSEIYSEDEKRDKIKRLHDVVEKIRDEYEP